MGLLSGTIGVGAAAIPSLVTLEDSLGLRILFGVRGPTGDAPGVVVVSMDESSAAILGLSTRSREWPRTLHGRLVDTLARRGATAIAFDVDFFTSAAVADDDRKFAEAIANAGTVVLVERIDLMKDGVKRQDPIPVLGRAALGLAPAPLPDAEPISRFYTFLSLPNQGEWPTLPAVMLQAHALPALGPLLDLLGRLGVSDVEHLPRGRGRIAQPGDLIRLTQDLRRAFLADHELAGRARQLLRSGRLPLFAPTDAELVEALIDLYDGSPLPYANYYGPPGTVCTIPYHALVQESSVEMPLCDIAGKAVFVGSGMSPLGKTDQADAHATVFSQSGGVHLSGVEIHASAFANLLSRGSIRPIGPAAYVAWLFGFGALVAASAFLLRVRGFRARTTVGPRVSALVLALALGAAQYGIAQALFTSRGLLVPLVVPLLAQLPAGLLLALVVAPGRVREVVRGVCLSTDVRGYTPFVAEQGLEMASRLMSEYFSLLSGIVERHGGTATSAGDSLMCAWREPTGLGSRIVSRLKTGSRPELRNADQSTRLRACLAALDLSAAVARFNERHPETPLITRIGLHAGRMAVEYDGEGGGIELVGDAANAADRLQSLNKQLSAGILASAAVVRELGEVLFYRRLGSFELQGFSDAVSVFEIVGRPSDVAPEDQLRIDRFAQALAAFEDGREQDASRLFERLLAECGPDGPSRFYLARCRQGTSAGRNNDTGPAAGSPRGERQSGG